MDNTDKAFLGAIIFMVAVIVFIVTAACVSEYTTKYTVFLSGKTLAVDKCYFEKGGSLRYVHNNVTYRDNCYEERCECVSRKME